MINFRIKFLICFAKPEPPPKKEAKAKKASKLAGNKGKQKKTSGSEAPKNEPEPEEKDENVVNCVENAREWCHIEYSLLEGVLPTVEINVVTWGEAAKVFSVGDCRSVKTALIGNLVWVYFEIHHKINVLNDEDLVRFKDSKIKFSFSQDNKKIMPDASNDWPKQFAFCNKTTIKEDDKEDLRWFSELRQVDPPDDKYDESSLKLDTYKISRPVNKSIVSMIKVQTCDKGLESKINNVTASLPAIERPLDSPKKGKGKKVSFAKGKKSDKKGKGDQTQENDSQLFVDAGLLIAGTYDACAERKEITQTLRYACVFISSSKILTDEQDYTYAPLIVSVQAFEALPITNIEQHNVKKVFARYELANVLDEIETQQISLQDNIAVDETRVFFLSSPEEESNHETLMQRPSMMALAEALLTRRFVVKIYGETGLEEGGVEPCIFGDRPTDPFISTPGHAMFLNYRPPSYSTEVFIGSACFNLIKLIKGYSVVEACSILTSSQLSSWDPACDFSEIIADSQNEESRRALLSRFTTSGVIPESIFLEHNSTVKLKVRTTCQLTVPESSFLLKIPQVSHRAIIIFKDQSCNDKVVELIERTNLMLLENFTESVASSAQSVRFIRNSTSSHLSLMSTRLSECRKLNLTVQEISRKRDIPKTVSTGFFIEHEDQSILVIESMTYVIPPLISQMQAMLNTEDCARVICDSSLFFTQRLYMEFFPTNILRIKLPVSLNDLLKNTSYYSTKSVFDESLQTLLLLDLLRRCRTLNSACVNQLFPSKKQLISFCKEFGVGENSSSFNVSSNTSF